MDSQPKRPFTISVEGNIGCGKTYFLSKFSTQIDGIEIYKEPVQEWTNVGSFNLLQMMYNSPTRCSFLFQMYALLTVIKQYHSPSIRKVQIIERFLGRYCFVENLYETGKISNAEYTVIREWFNYLARPYTKFDLSIDLVVYLRCPPEIAYERILKRKRREESNIPFEYICQIHDLHEAWLIKKTKFQTPSAIIIIDVSESIQNLESVFEDKKKIILDIARSANKM